MRGLRAFSKRAQNFRFMTTRKGYLGWAPDSANTRKMKEAIPGDLICILLGCSVPMVVRPKGEQYEIIRECYVQGFMHGEALKNTDALGLKIERMSFC
ncbi:hypothetical protein B0J14DRAFT_287597 [Halenospora varia]|nr:hypothetical protein B0J14DRAFT_287597 [Halenospora varia]